MVASNEQGQNWSFLLSRVVLVESLHVPVLWGASHATQILIIPNCLQVQWHARYVNLGMGQYSQWANTVNAEDTPWPLEKNLSSSPEDVKVIFPKVIIKMGP